MNHDIFRKQALDEAAAPPIPGVTLAPPPVGWLFCTLGIIVLSILTGLLVFGTYTTFAQADGIIVPSTGLLPTQVDHAGIVTRIFVRDGDRVRKGEPLLQLSEGQGTPNHAETQTSILIELASKKQRLRDDLKDDELASKRQAGDIRGKISSLEQQVSAAAHEADTQRERAANAMSLYATWMKANGTGLVSRSQLLIQHDAALQAKAQASASVRTLIDLQRQLTDAQSQLVALPEKSAEKRRITERAMSDVTQSILEHEAVSASVVYASVDGTVTGSMVHVGDALDAREPAMSILPSGSILRAELWIPSSEIGFVATGDTVLLRYDAFPYRRYGQGKGVVLEVARTAVQPAQVLKWAGLQAKEPRYRVIVKLEAQSVRAFGADQPLLPGMVLNARVVLQRHRLIDWATISWKSM